MIRLVGTIFAGLLGLAFGSFLNVCVSRWPAGESVVRPRSHCRACGRMLKWWENVPLVSWIALRGRCRTCGASIGWRYAAVELAVGGLWAAVAWDLAAYLDDSAPVNIRISRIAASLGSLLFYWLLVALAALDAEQLWLPDWLTLAGVGVAIADKLAVEFLLFHSPSTKMAGTTRYDLAIEAVISALLAAGLILLIRWIYWLLRHREGIGLGDAKLMAMLGAWLGLEGALLAFGLAVILGSAFALVLLATRAKHDGDNWAAAKIPLGTFLCLGGIVSGLFGDRIFEAYLRWAGF